MAVIETWYNQDLQQPVKVRYLDGSMFSHNGNGNRIGVRVYNDGEPVTLTGKVSGYVITSDGSTVPCVGARSGNEATITIPPAAYQPGNAFITIFLTDGSTVTTLCAAQTTVLQARTGSQVSPGSVVQDWTQTINAAMQDVQTAADNLGGIVATQYARLTYPVPLGKYTYHNGNLYRCISAIAASEEFTAAHWTQVRLGDDVTDLKSAFIDSAEHTTYTMTWYQGSIGANGKNASNQKRCRTDFMSFGNDTYVEFDPGSYKYFVVDYNTNDVDAFNAIMTPVYATGVYGFVPTEGHYYRFCIGLVSDDDLAPDDVTELSLYSTKPISDIVDAIETEIAGYVNRAMISYGNLITAGLDLNGGDFIHPGTWTVNDVQYMPANSPTDKKCRIVSFASQTDNTIYTLQLVADIAGNIYTRFSPNTTIWESDWYDWKANIAKKADEYPYNVQAFKPMWVDSELFVNNYTITHHGASEENKVSKMYALYDGMDSTATTAGITVTKDNLGKDASNTFNIYNYKVSLNTGEKPVVLLIVGEHGDELNSAMLGYYAYREIIDGVLTKYLKYVDFWVVPLMNPYGYEYNMRNNSQNVNLNRDFPCEWQYSTSEHNKTGNTALSQPETNYIYDLIVNNKDKILFMCNKHDTGPIATKIGTNQEDIVGYMSSYLDNDITVNNGMAQIQNALVRQTDAWIINNCSIDISNRQLIASRKVKTSGSLDLFANSIGVHGSLVEICNSAISGDYPYYPSGAGHHADLARLGLNLFVNYLMATIENNMDILKDNRLYGDLKYYSRKLVDGNYVDIELEWTGTELVEKT